MSLSKIKRDFLSKEKISEEEYEEWKILSVPAIYKFLPWMISQWLSFDKSINKKNLINIVRSFRRLSDKNLIKNKDIYSYSFEELTKKIKSKKIVRSRSEEKKEIKTKGSQRLEEKAGIYLYRIDSHQACVEYGKGTKWCIASPDKEEWEDHVEDNLLQFYFIINTKVKDRDPQSKIAISVDYSRKDITIYDSKDDIIDLNNYLSTWDIKEWEKLLLPLPDEIIILRLKKEREYIIDNSIWDEEGKGWHYKGSLVLHGKIKPFGFNSIQEYLGDIRLLSTSKRFVCSYNNLKTLEGSPQEIGGSFYCHDNKLKSLKGSPKIVKGYFDCRYNKIESLEGSPLEIGGSFNCSYNKLKSLGGLCSKIGGDLLFQHNKFIMLNQ